MVMMSRQKSFDLIATAIQPHLVLSASGAIVAEGDSLVLLKSFPAHSVSLILTDPPYHATKKKNIYGDTAFAEDQHYLDWMADYAAEWYRVLRPNGSLFVFCDSSMAGRLEAIFLRFFNVLSNVVWTKPNDPGFDGWKGKMKKEALRQWYPHSERIIFAEPATEGNLHRSPFGLFLRQARQKAGLSTHELTARIGAHGKINHGGAVSNWEDGRNTPSREQYQKICTALIDTGKIESMPPYEDVIRVFNVDASKEFTDVWTFPSVRPYKGKHPAEKPSALLEHAIAATTYPDDVVLDCFAGSGNTALAALNLARRTISIEIDSAWAAKIAQRVEDLYAVKATLEPEKRHIDRRSSPMSSASSACHRPMMPGTRSWGCCAGSWRRSSWRTNGWPSGRPKYTGRHMATQLKTDMCEYGDCNNPPVYSITFQVLDGTIMRGNFCDPCARVLGQLHHIIRVDVTNQKPKEEVD